MRWRERTGQRQDSVEEIVLTLYLGPFICRDRFSASRSLTVCLTRTPWYTLLEYSDKERKEASDSILSLFHGKTSQIRQNPPRDEQPGPHQDPVQEVQGAA